MAAITDVVAAIERAAADDAPNVSPYIQREAGRLLDGPDAQQLTSRLSETALAWLRARGLIAGSDE